ncbi:MAG: regulatory iron-sulfur-containing complex subunit RicT [Bacteroidales bacterium]|nr:regulatory iron-sulfur-containing complex subunit RicT [Bacteroidales bacterium]
MDIEENRTEEEDQYIPKEVIYQRDNYKLNSINWLSDIPETGRETDLVEIRFKNTRKGYFRNVNSLRLEEGEIVAVEASPGHDIGRVSLTGRLVESKLKHGKTVPKADDIKKVYRKAKPVDTEKWEEARKREIPTMLKSRQIARELNLNMKIGDVEYQGDNTKAIFYYISDERVDFRQLIKRLAEEFRIRIEMRQIGARQEAGRIGGIGSCGRELCCSSHLTDFVSVTTTHARQQELSLNPQKLAGQCGKLKCCLNYEFDCYLEKQQQFPPKKPLETIEGKAFFTKMEIFKGLYWYSFDPGAAANTIAVPVERVREIQKMNSRGEKPNKLVEDRFDDISIDSYGDIVGGGSLTRFDNKNDNRKKRKKKGKKRYKNAKRK